MTTSERVEELLRLAAAEPGHRPEFYRALLDSTVFVLGEVEGQPEGSSVTPAGARMSLQNWQRPDGSAVIPFFTSLPALQRALEQETRYVALAARALFEITRGAALVLNPGSEYGKEFLPHEIAALLEAGVNAQGTRRTVEAETQVMLGQPREYPSAMVAALTTLLAKHGNVRAGYLALMHDPSVDESPHLLVGLECDGAPDAAIREAGAVANETRPDQPVDFVRVVRGEKGLSQYLLEETKPFYERTWGSRLMTALRPRRA